MSTRHPFQKVLLATDLGDSALTPWAHALKLSCHSGADLTVLHVRGDGERSRWGKLPTARDLLVQWGELDENSTVHEFRALGFRLYLHSLQHDRALDGIESGLEAIAPELVVLGSRRAAGLDRLFRGSVSETVSRHAPQAALVVPTNAKPIVHPQTGVVGIPRIVVPLASGTNQRQAIDGAIRLVRSLSDGPAEFVLLHVGPRGGLPLIELPRRGQWTWRTVYAEGPVVATILDTADRVDASAISMLTHGHDSMFDVLQGSRTERVMRHAPCPVLVQPLAA